MRFIILLSFCLSVMGADYPIVPEPQKLTALKGMFQLNKDVCLQFTPTSVDAKRAALYLQDFLEKSEVG